MCNPIRRLATFANVANVAVLALFAASALSAADLRVMTVGDSITSGFIYQPRLKTLLEGAGHTVTFVGAQGSGANLHEGFSGKGIYDFVGAIPLASGSNHYITTALNSAWPSAPAGAVPVVLVHIGVNDLGHGLGRVNLTNAPLDGSGNCLAAQQYAQVGGSWIDPLGNLDGMTYSAWLKLRLDTFVDLVLAHSSQPRLVVAKILPIAKGNSLYQAYNDNCCERIKEWNGYWAAKAAAVTGAAAARITVVDCYTDAEAKRVYGAIPGTSFWGDATAQASDWVHPSSAVGGGYTLMATQFKSGIDTLLSATPIPAATWSGTQFSEASANDGTVSTTLTVTLANETFTGVNGDNFVSGGKVTATNVPTGLTAVVQRTSATQVSVNVTGTATAHANANDVANLGLTFADSAVTSGAASAVSGLSVSNRSIDFSDAPPVGGLLVSEPFAYTAAVGGLASQNGGTGWTAAWDAGAQTIAAPGLTYTSGGTLAVAGNRADIVTTATSYRALPTTLSSGTWWISFIARSSTPGSLWGGLSLFNGATEQLFIGQRWASSVWGLEGNGDVNSAVNTGADSLLVVKLVLGAGNDSAYLWVNPSLAATPADGAATQHLAFADLSVTRIRLAGGVDWQCDELRIGDSFAAISPLDTVVPGAFAWSAATASVAEGGTVTLTVTRSGGSSGAVSVPYATANGTAAAPGDFTAGSGTVDFLAGELSKTVSVVTVQDTLVEGDEAFTVTLSAPGGSATLGSPVTCTVTITDDDVAPAGTFAWSAATASVAEGGTSTLTITRTGGSAGAVSVTWATAAGSAGAPGDFTTGGGSLAFAAGETSTTVSVVTVQDLLVEGAETFTVTLSAPLGGATLGSPATCTVTITDDDVAPAGTFAWSAATASVAEGGTSTLTITRTGGSAGAVSVTWATAAGSAGAPGDFTTGGGSLAFAAGETSTTVSVVTVQDLLVEGAESFTVTLSAPLGGATLGAPATCTVAIVDDEPAAAAASGAATLGNGDGGCGLGSGFAVMVASLAFAGLRRRR